MSNLVEWIEEEAHGEEILAIVIGEMGWGSYGSESVPEYDQIPFGKVLSWDHAKKWLTYEFDSGYGAPGCNAIYAWTENRIIAIGQYDGATWPYSLPRNPMDIMPGMEGG